MVVKGMFGNGCINELAMTVPMALPSLFASLFDGRPQTGAKKRRVHKTE